MKRAIPENIEELGAFYRSQMADSKVSVPDTLWGAIEKSLPASVLSTDAGASSTVTNTSTQTATVQSSISASSSAVSSTGSTLVGATVKAKILTGVAAKITAGVLISSGVVTTVYVANNATDKEGAVIENVNESIPNNANNQNTILYSDSLQLENAQESENQFDVDSKTDAAATKAEEAASKEASNINQKNKSELPVPSLDEKANTPPVNSTEKEPAAPVIDSKQEDAQATPKQQEPQSTNEEVTTSPQESKNDAPIKKKTFFEKKAAENKDSAGVLFKPKK